MVACEFSGAVRSAFRALGHDAWSCDLLPAADGSEFHLQGDVKFAIAENNGFFFPQLGRHVAWDLMIAHPPCTYLCSSGLHWNKRRPGRAALTEESLEFVRLLLDAPIERIALENPIGCIGTRIRPASQIIQPYQFGHDASKQTCLWLKNLPLLKGTRYVEPRIVNGKKRWGNQTDSGQNKLGPSADRWALRSETYPGIAQAMADQWGN